MGIAGIYREWTSPAGEKHFTFSMITVNADDHPVMSRFHAPGDEKRMVVILDPADYGAWLTCPVVEAPKFFKQWHGEFETWAAPLAPRVSKTKRPTAPPAAGDLF